MQDDFNVEQNVVVRPLKESNVDGDRSWKYSQRDADGERLEKLLEMSIALQTAPAFSFWVQ